MFIVLLPPVTPVTVHNKSRSRLGDDASPPHDGNPSVPRPFSSPLQCSPPRLQPRPGHAGPSKAAVQSQRSPSGWRCCCALG